MQIVATVMSVSVYIHHGVSYELQYVHILITYYLLHILHMYIHIIH